MVHTLTANSIPSTAYSNIKITKLQQVFKKNIQMSTYIHTTKLSHYKNSLPKCLQPKIEKLSYYAGGHSYIRFHY